MTIEVLFIKFVKNLHLAVNIKWVNTYITFITVSGALCKCSIKT